MTDPMDKGPWGYNNNETGIDSECCVMQVIVTNILRRGKGIEGDPIRIIRQLWTLDGRLIAEVDTWKEQRHD